jgi:hypothetical protein
MDFLVVSEYSYLPHSCSRGIWTNFNRDNKSRQDVILMRMKFAPMWEHDRVEIITVGSWTPWINTRKLFNTLSCIHVSSWSCALRLRIPTAAFSWRSVMKVRKAAVGEQRSQSTAKVIVLLETMYTGVSILLQRTYLLNVYDVASLK